MHHGNTDIILFYVGFIVDHCLCNALQLLVKAAIGNAGALKKLSVRFRRGMVKKHSVFEFHAVRRQSNGVARGGERIRFEITVDQQLHGVRRRDIHRRLLQHGIGKRYERSGCSSHGTAVANLEIDHLIALGGNDLNGGSKLIQFIDLDHSANQDLDVFSFKSNR